MSRILLLLVVLACIYSGISAEVNQQCKLQAEDYTKCGETIVADSGIIRYKHREPLEQYKGCFWLIRANLFSSVVVRVIDHGFPNEQIRLYRMFLDGEVNSHADWKPMNGEPITIEGPMILVTLHAPYENSTGFIMSFEGCGPNIENPPTFTHYDTEQTPGITQYVSYPGDGQNYLPNQFVSYLGQRQDRAHSWGPSLSDWKVIVTYQDIQPSQYCLFADSLKFYYGLVGFYPAVDEDGEFINRFCEQNSTTHHIVPALSPKYGNIYPKDIGILAVFQSNGFREGLGFSFEW